MNKTLLLLCLLFASCTAINKTAYQIEETHNALYKQEALIVYAVKSNKVLLLNPMSSRCYFLRGKQYIRKWAPGDTMIIDDNLEDFYSLKIPRKCKINL